LNRFSAKIESPEKLKLGKQSRNPTQSGKKKNSVNIYDQKKREHGKKKWREKIRRLTLEKRVIAGAIVRIEGLKKRGLNVWKRWRQENEWGFAFWVSRA